jgi:hypothetical protein
MDLTDCIAKGRKQGGSMHASRIRPTALTSVLSTPMAENQEPDED